MEDAANQRIAGVVEQESSRLRNFIRRRVPGHADAEDILQDVFSKLVEANRLLMPIQHITGWLFRVARNRITDYLRNQQPQPMTAEDWDLITSADAGPETAYMGQVLFDALELALEELPAEQREVFIAHELEGRSFKEIAAATGVSVNTLLSRKHYAVLHLRERLRALYDEWMGT